MDGMKARTRISRTMNKTQQTGFTLIEVMVVVLILAVLATFVAPKFLGKPEEARIVRVKSDLQALKTSLDLYRLENFSYPSTADGLKALVTKPASAPDNWKQYLNKEPLDPWGIPYKYMNPGQHGEIDIYSFGPDRQAGTDDVGNWVDEKS